MNFKILLVGLFLCFKIGAPNTSALSEYLSPEHFRVAQSTQGLDRIQAVAKNLLQKLGPNFASGCAEVAYDLTEKVAFEFEEIMKIIKEIKLTDSTSLRKLFDAAQPHLRKVTILSSPHLDTLRAACCKAETSKFLEEVLSAQNLGELIAISQIGDEPEISSMRGYQEKAEIIRDYVAHQIVEYYANVVPEEGEVEARPMRIADNGKRSISLAGFLPTLEETELFLNSYCTMVELDRMYRYLMSKEERDKRYKFISLSRVKTLSDSLLGVNLSVITNEERLATYTSIDFPLHPDLTYVKKEYAKTIIYALESEDLDSVTRKAIMLGKRAASQEVGRNIAGWMFEDPHRGMERKKKEAECKQQKCDERILQRKQDLVRTRRLYIEQVAKELLKSLEDSSPILDELKSVDKIGNSIMSTLDSMGARRQEPHSVISEILPFLERIGVSYDAEFLTALRKEAQLAATKNFLEAVLSKVNLGMNNCVSDISFAFENSLYIEQIANRRELGALMKYAEDEAAIKDDWIKILNESVDLGEARPFAENMLTILTLTIIIEKETQRLGTVAENAILTRTLENLKNIEKQLRETADKVAPKMYETLLLLAKSKCGIEISVLRKMLEAYEKADFDIGKHIKHVAGELLGSLDKTPTLDEFKSTGFDSPPKFLEELVDLMLLIEKVNFAEGPNSANLPFFKQIRARCSVEFLIDLKKEIRIVRTKDFLENALKEISDLLGWLDAGKAAIKKHLIQKISDLSELISWRESKEAPHADKAAIRGFLIQRFVSESLSLEEAQLFVDGMLTVLTVTTIFSEFILAEKVKISDSNDGSKKFDEIFEKLQKIDEHIKSEAPGMHESLLPLAKSRCDIRLPILREMLEAYKTALL
jgi:hypothetical protein